MKKLIMIIAILLVSVKGFAQYENQHLLGVKYSYNLSGSLFDPSSLGGGFAQSPVNVSLLYTYYHSLWGDKPYFGIQIGLKYGQEVVLLKNRNEPYGKDTYGIAEIPLLSQFRIPVTNNFKFMVTLGPFAAYRLNVVKMTGYNEETKEYEKSQTGFNEDDKRIDYGIEGGLGIGYTFRPFELHFEVQYKYGLGNLYELDKFSSERWVYANTHHIMFSLSLHVHLDKDKRKKRF